MASTVTTEQHIDPVEHFTHDDHVYFEERAIDLNDAIRHGVRRLGDAELQRWGFRAPKGKSGIVFPCRNPLTGVETAGVWKPDAECGCDGKYLRAKDHGGTPRNRTFFFSADATKEVLEKNKVPLFICESPAKAIALQEALREADTSGVTIGLNGVNGGWFRPREMVPKADGGLREKRTHPRLCEDFDEIALKGRNVFIVFDNDTNTHKHAERYFEKPKGGVIYAEEVLAGLLAQRHATVALANLPYKGDVLGVDDFIKKYGAKRVVDEIWGYSIAKRNPSAILQAPEGGRLTPQTAESLYGEQGEQPEELVGPRLLERQCVYMVSGPAKFGKSLLVTNLMASLESGEPFLGTFHVKQRCKSLYVSYEMPKHAISERFQSCGIHDSLYLDAMDPVDPMTGKSREWALNPNRSQGFKGVVEAEENQANLRELEGLVKEHKVGVVVIDPLIDAIDVSPNDEVVARSTVKALRGIAVRQNCAVVLVHHTRKRAREGVGNGADEAAGSANWVRKCDGAITGELAKERDFYRFRLHFTLRYSHIDDQELFRGNFNAGEYGMKAETWKSAGKSIWDSRERELMDTFGGEEVSSKEVARQLELSDSQVSKLLKRVLSRGSGKKVKNGLYVLDGGKEAE